MTKDELKETINGLPQHLSLSSIAAARAETINIRPNMDSLDIRLETTTITLKELLCHYIDELDTEHSNICKKITPKVLEKRIKLWAKSKNLGSEFEYLVLDACLDLFSKDINWREQEENYGLI